MIRIEVPGRCVPAPRMTRYSKHSPTTMRYMHYRNQIGWIAKQKKVPKLKGPVTFSAIIYLSKAGREGDLDNYAKTLKDALNGIAWEDDRQVVESHCYKVYVPSVDDQRVVIEIEKA